MSHIQHQFMSYKGTVSPAPWASPSAESKHQPHSYCFTLTVDVTLFRYIYEGVLRNKHAVITDRFSQSVHKLLVSYKIQYLILNKSLSNYIISSLEWQMNFSMTTIWWINALSPGLGLSFLMMVHVQSYNDKLVFTFPLILVHDLSGLKCTKENNLPIKSLICWSY